MPDLPCNCLISPLSCSLQVSPLQPLGFTTFYTLWTSTHPFKSLLSLLASRSPFPPSAPGSPLSLPPFNPPFSLYSPTLTSPSVLPSPLHPPILSSPSILPPLYILQFSLQSPSRGSDPSYTLQTISYPHSTTRTLNPGTTAPSHTGGRRGVPSAPHPKAPDLHLPPPGAERGLSPDPLCLGGPAEPPYMRSPRL